MLFNVRGSDPKIFTIALVMALEFQTVDSYLNIKAMAEDTPESEGQS